MLKFFELKNILKANRYYIIINPNAGKGEAHDKWTYVQNQLTENKIDFKFEFTDEPGHCYNIVQHRIKKGYRNFICVGGDGTLNEIINATFSQKEVPTNEITVGLIPMGTGNDWKRYYNFPDEPKEAIEVISKRNVKRQDVGEIMNYNKGEKKLSYFINIAGLGFDSTVARATNAMKKRGNRSFSAYFISMIKCLIGYKHWDLKIQLNGKTLEGKFLSVSIGNGKYSGSGMLQTPNAVINDGLLDITLYNNVPKLKVAWNIKNLYNGKILNVSGVKSYRTHSLKIESPHEIFAEVDGEIIGDGPYEIRVIPNSLNVIIP